jgi:MATE family multidrug resistance protein
VAASLIPLAGVFQVFDGTQAVGMGVLRGIGDTRAPVVINVLGYYVVGLPIGLFLGFRMDQGARGLWWGLVIGLAAVAVALVLRVSLRMRRDLRRVEIDSRPD